MNYEIAYKEALERARVKYEAHNNSWSDEDIEEIFSELKESEDEKIRKAIIDYFNLQEDNTTYSLISKKDIINWLEKQGKEEYALKSFKHEDVYKFMEYIEKEAKAYDFNLPHRGYDIYAFAKDILYWLEKQGEKTQSKTTLEAIKEENVDNANKVELKLKVGDWIVNNNSGGIYQVTEIIDNKYCLWPLDGEIMGYLRIVDVDNDYHLWTIQDAKDGDVLATVGHKRPFIYKGCLDPNHPGSPVAYCGIDSQGYFCIGGDKFDHWWTAEKIRPATKEQLDLLFVKMREAGYKWDKNKKELIRIEKQGEQKSKWSYNDEQIVAYISNHLRLSLTDEEYAEYRHWIKSIKQMMEE